MTIYQVYLVSKRSLLSRMTWQVTGPDFFYSTANVRSDSNVYGLWTAFSALEFTLYIVAKSNFSAG